MSSFSRLLRNPISHLFSRGLSSSSSPSPSPTPNPLSSPVKSFISEITREKDLRKVVQRFKTASENYRFRCSYQTYSFTVTRLATANRFSWIEELLEDQKQYLKTSNEGFAVRLIALYGKSGMFSHASKMFDELPQYKCPQTLKSFNALLTAALDSKNFEIVGEIFRKLPSELSIKPDIFSYNILIQAFCKVGSLDSAVSVLEMMEENGVRPNSITFNTLLNWFYYKNQFDEAQKIWAKMEEHNCVPDIATFNAKLRGLASEGKTKEAVKLVDELGLHGLRPDIFSFNALIKGFCNEGNLEEAKNIYNELLKKGCVPDRVTFETLVPSLCKKGDLDMAVKLSKEIKNRRISVKAGILQGIIDALAKESKNMGPKKIKQLGLSKVYYGPSLKIPSAAQ
ncbi:small ribosomal subunit protein mS78 (rPPR3a)-like isoform X1 [Tasmannia lanceolata]|uniref:small ribosomal subunit protein mS78 (rPPR3a)-like isoform X1 n=1 Tax=Tasmannia lanceolata TaxID=3420 RepID=UPI004064743A